MAEKPLKGINFPGLEVTYEIPQIDDTLTAEGKAADAKKVGDELAKKADAKATGEELAKKAGYVLLWSNAIRTNSFAAQEINVSTAGYDHLLIVCGYNTQLAYGQSVQHIWLRTEGAGVSRDCLTVERISDNSLVKSFREVTVPLDRTKVGFGGGYSPQNTADDTFCIPYYIYGIKGVRNP